MGPSKIWGPEQGPRLPRSLGVAWYSGMTIVIIKILNCISIVGNRCCSETPVIPSQDSRCPPWSFLKPTSQVLPMI